MCARIRLLSIPLLALTLLALAGLAACRVPSPAPTVRVAVGLPLHAPFGREILKGVHMALEDAHNQAGPWRVEARLFNTYDAHQQPTLSAALEEQAVRAAIDDDSVVAYLGSLSSHQAKAVMVLLNEASMAQVSPTATWPGLTKAGFAPGEPGAFYPTGQRHFFRVIPADDILVEAAARWARDLGVQRVFVLDNGLVHGKNATDIFATMARDFSIELLGRRSLRPSPDSLPLEDFDGLAREIAEAQPDLVYYGGATGGPATELIRTLRRYLPDVKILGPDTLLSPDLIQELGAQAEGVMATHMVPPVHLSDSARAFVDRYRETHGHAPQNNVLCAYEAMRVLLLAIERTPNLTRQAVLTSLSELRDFDGLFGRWHFDEHGDMSQQPVGGFAVRAGEWMLERRL